MKNTKLKVEKFILTNWTEAEEGLLIAENAEWVLVKHIPTDYIIDGYRLYKKDLIEKRLNTVEEKQIEKVLKLKGIDTDLPNNFEFCSTIKLLQWIEKHYGIFEFQDDDEDELVYGKVNKLIGDKLVIKMINADGSVEKDYNYEYNINDIRIISFASDYNLSIELLWKDKIIS